MSFHSLQSLDDGGINFSLGSFGSNPHHHGGGGGSLPRSLVKCGIIVGDLPHIPNRIRALARVIQNADSLQFPDLRDRSGDLEEEAVRQMLKELGVTLSREEEHVFPIALRECKRTLWRAAVYGRDGQQQSSTTSQPDSGVRSIQKVLEICNSIDTEAAFAGAALGSIPEGVLVAYTMFAQIAQMDRDVSTKKVLICLYEKIIEPLQSIHRIIRDHNLYQTRRQAVFSEEEVQDVGIENERLMFLMKHLEAVMNALEEGRHFSMARMFDDKFLINAWSTCFGDSTVAVLMSNDALAALTSKNQDELAKIKRDSNTSTTSSSNNNPSLTTTTNKNTKNDPSLFDFESEALEYFFDHFPPWSREMMKSVLDFHQHGILSVFSLQKALRVWGPSTLMPFKVANDIRRKRFLLGSTPKAARKHLENIHSIHRSLPSNETADVINQRLEDESTSISSNKSKAVPAQNAFTMCLSSQETQETIAIFVKTLRKDGHLRVRQLEMHKRDGVWQIDGITSQFQGGLGGYETVSAAIVAFNNLFEYPCGTNFDDLETIANEKAEKNEKKRREEIEKKIKRKNLVRSNTNSPGRAEVQAILQQNNNKDENSSPAEGTNTSTTATAIDTTTKKESASASESYYSEQHPEEIEQNPFGEIAEFSETTCLLHRAVYSCDLPLVRKLLSTGSEGVVNYPQPDEVISGANNFWTPLIYACCSPITRAAECCKILTDHGADASFMEEASGRSALYFAILNGHAEAVAHLLRCNPNLQASSTTVSPLFVALGAHWLHPDINDIHTLAGVKISADVIRSILYYGSHHRPKTREARLQEIERRENIMSLRSSSHEGHEEYQGSSIRSPLESPQEEMENIRRDLLLVLQILEVKQKGMDAKYAADEEAANGEFKMRHEEAWRMNSSLIRDEQRARLKTSIIAHGAFARSEDNSIAELFRARRIIQGYLCYLSCQALCEELRS